LHLPSSSPHPPCSRDSQFDETPKLTPGLVADDVQLALDDDRLREVEALV